jgi:hypothetical protein
VLLFDYGHLKSVSSGRPVGADGQPIPWYTYPAVEYLEQLDFSGCSVFEYGAGNSTLFWAARAGQVISVEDDEGWHRLMLSKVPANCRLIHQEDLARYVDAIEEFPAGFDVIVVDGAARGLTRLKCARAAVPYLKPGGMIILDNADWLPESARTLRNAGLIEVDMTGPVAIRRRPHSSCTATSRVHPARAGSPSPGQAQPRRSGSFRRGRSRRWWSSGVKSSRPSGGIRHSPCTRPPPRARSGCSSPGAATHRYGPFAPARRVACGPLRAPTHVPR